MTTYTPTVWQDGDIITAQKLNKIENRLEEIQNLMKYRITIMDSLSSSEQSRNSSNNDDGEEKKEVNEK